MRTSIAYILSIMCLFIMFLMCIRKFMVSTKKLQKSKSMNSRPYCIQLDSANVGRTLDLSRIFVKQDVDLASILPVPRRSILPFQTEQEDKDEEDRCISLANWQKLSFPTCNGIHEYEMIENGEYINSGFNRDVWALYDKGTAMAIKTLVFDHSFSRDMIDKQRIDALISERTTSSEHITSVYSYCE